MTVRRLSSLMLLALASSLPAGSAHAQTPYAGSWKVIVRMPGQDLTLWLIQLSEEGGKPILSVLDSGQPGLMKPKVEGLKVEKSQLRCQLVVPNAGFSMGFELPSGVAKPAKLLGFLEVRGQKEFALLQRTELQKLDPRDLVSRAQGIDEAQAALGSKDPKAKVEKLKAFLSQRAEDRLSIAVAEELFATLALQGASEAELRKQLEPVVAKAAEYGPQMRQQTLHRLVMLLLVTNKQPNLAADLAKQAVSLLTADAAEGVRLGLLKSWHSALTRAGKIGKAADVAKQIDPIERRLDEEFENQAIGFTLQKPAARIGKSNRIAVVELFTGAQCPPCVAADTCFDAVLRSYGDREVVLLQYHLHVPGPDPLTNADCEARSLFYNVEGTPALYLDGKEGPPVGGFRPESKGHYETLMRFLGEEVESAPGAEIRLNASRAGSNITFAAAIDKLASPGDHVRLHVVLVEDKVRYAGRNGQRIHHNVVRAMAPDARGWALPQASCKQSGGWKLEELRASLKSYLDEAGKKRPFVDDDRPMEFKSLRVIAMVQDHKSKQILQSAQVVLPGEPATKKE